MSLIDDSNYSQLSTREGDSPHPFRTQRSGTRTQQSGTRTQRSGTRTRPLYGPPPLLLRQPQHTDAMRLTIPNPDRSIRIDKDPMQPGHPA